MTVSNLRQNIKIDVRGSQNKVKPGGTDERTITVKNWSQREVNLILWVKPQDIELLRWYDLKKIPFQENGDSDKKVQVELALPSKKDIEIKLTFKVPLNAEPKTYNYEICAKDKDSQYEENIPPCSQQLRVEASQQYLESRYEPSFVIEPKSNSESPHSLKPGEKFNIKITVKNRSVQTDEFYLIFPELDTAWFDDDTKSKLATKISLNPGQQETFNISLCPPEVITPPGNYFSTIRLRSLITRAVLLVDMIYFNILVDDRLELSDLSPPSQKIPSANPSFEFQVSNSGNIQRYIRFDGEDQEKLFTYKLESHSLLLEPGNQEKVIFTARLKPWWLWRRPWKGEGQVIPFQIDISNVNNELGSNLYIPEKPSGTIIWKAYSRWERWFLRLLFLIILGLLLWGAIELIVKPVVWQWIVKPSLQPKITELTTTKKSYQAGKGEGIRLNWEIRNLGQLNTINITPLYTQKSTTHGQLYQIKIIKSNKQTYFNGYQQKETTNSEQNLIEKLQNFLKNSFVKPIVKALTHNQEKEKEKEKEKEIYLNDLKEEKEIQDILDKLEKEETQIYLDELEKKEVKIDDLGFCKLIPTVPDTSIHTRIWQVIYSSNPEMKNHLIYKDKVLQCKNILAIPFPFKAYISNRESQENFRTINNEKDLSYLGNKNINYELSEGNYEFKVEAFTVNSTETPSASKTIKDIIVAPAPPQVPPPPPEILTFASTLPIYRKQDSQNTAKTNLQAQTKSPTSLIKLNWSIANPTTVNEIKITGTFLGLDGSYVPLPIPSYFVNKEKKVFIGLEKYCKIKELSGTLSCENVPINNTAKPGTYKFIITAVPILERKSAKTTATSKNLQSVNSPKPSNIKEISKTIESVQVKPTLPEITYFKAELPSKPEDKTDQDKTNDKDKQQNSSYVYMVDPAKDKGAINVNLSWDIKASDPVTVELLPAPGVVPPNLKNNMQYSLSPNPGATTVTLKVTNQAGESVTRTLVLQTALIIPPPATNNAASKKPQVPSVPPPPLPDGAAPSGSGSPSNPEELAPLELPPRAN